MSVAANPISQLRSSKGDLDLERIRADFPILHMRVHGKPLIYLDSAATSQKPRSVIEAIKNYYEASNANVHRGVHLLSQKATQAYEAARERTASFMGAGDSKEVIFTRGTTEAINLVAQSFLRPRIQKGDEILISEMEHHSNIVPWQLVCEQTGARLKILPMNDRGELELDRLPALLTPSVKFFSVVHVSNSLGTINPIADMIQMAREKKVPIMIDGAQAIHHMPVNVKSLDCDFYAFSGHKMYGPTGIGVLYGKKVHLESMPPYQGGGDMIRSVTFEKTTFNDLPNKFEAGTPDIAGAVGLHAAIDYLAQFPFDAVMAHEKDLLDYGTKILSEIPQIRMIGTARERSGVLSFVVEGIHAHDVGTILDRDGIAIRAGHHCTQPVMAHFGIPASNRASLAIYNRREDLDRLRDGLHHVLKVFG